jgi:hypothetical protein
MAVVHLALVTVCMRCSMLSGPDTTIVNGGGLETQNALVIISAGDSIAGRTHAGVALYLYPARYLPFERNLPVKIAESDTDGVFSFTHLDSGAYSLHAIDSQTLKAAFVQGIQAAAGLTDTLRDTLRRPVILSGAAFETVPDSVQGTIDTIPIPAGAGFIYIPGSPFSAITGSSGGFQINDVPSGTYQVVLRAQSSQSGQAAIADSQHVRIGVSGEVDKTEFYVSVDRQGK